MPPPASRLSKKRIILGFISGVILAVAFIISGATPDNSDVIISVTRGESIRQIARELKEANIIRSSALFSLLVQTSDNPIVSAGDYLFQTPQNIFTVADRFRNGHYGLPIMQITVIEGMTVVEISEKVAERFPQFNKAAFIEIALPHEGYLFPDTYIFNQSVTAEEVFDSMSSNFNKKIASIQDLIDSSPYTLEQIIIMASIVEREATKDSREEVASILWNRFEIGMALQVDASFVYGIGKATADLTREDLAKDGPYNTYLNVGLTPTAISNPGLDAIKAAALPHPTNNLYFLTGRDGEMYYAESFEAHKRNRALYLD